jgi:hypothetical protein
MVKPPIRVEREHYRGSDPKRRAKVARYNEDAATLEQHINAQIAKGKRGVFMYYEISRDTGIPLKRVEEILFTVDCGHNGFTVVDETESA